MNRTPSGIVRYEQLLKSHFNARSTTGVYISDINKLTDTFGSVFLIDNVRQLSSRVIRELIRHTILYSQLVIFLAPRISKYHVYFAKKIVL